MVALVLCLASVVSLAAAAGWVLASGDGVGEVLRVEVSGRLTRHWSRPSLAVAVGDTLVKNMRARAAFQFERGSVGVASPRLLNARSRWADLRQTHRSTMGA